MKKPLFLLMLAMLVVVASELQVPAVMPEMAADLNVDTGKIGLLVSLFALGMALGGPVIAFFLRYQPPKRGLLIVIAAYTIPEIAVPLIDEYWWVALMRIATGCLAGAAVGLSVGYAARLAPDPSKIGEAVSIVLSGVMAGVVVGLPVSHFIASHLNWQATFYVLGVAALLVFLVSLAALPEKRAASVEDSAQDLRNLRQPRLWSRFMVSFLTIGSAYAAFSYFTPLLEQSAGFGSDATTLILLAYGLCSLVGNIIVGKLADKHAINVLRFGHALLFISLGVLALAAENQLVVLVMVLIVGLAGVTMNPPLVTRVVEIGGSGNLVATVHMSVITLGIAAGTAVSATTISASGNDPAVAMWTGCVFALLAAFALGLQTERKATAKPSEDR
ncbi:MFS transporter [Paracoccus liaowanqingii]|uniref:MFS transporter n=1 Tax=Paracoccus liaowanqingii TaxID=2560053 RepID=A0A4Z1C7G3_9RHOB|nr:MFS transporter [Paracoccus liaowanqingii]TGN55954.1 MFS transporter [Paracoccus liaowanqingii]